MKYWALFKESFLKASHESGGWHWYAAKLRRSVVRASRTCTLWQPGMYGDYLEFVPYPAIRISMMEIVAEG